MNCLNGLKVSTLRTAVNVPKKVKIKHIKAMQTIMQNSFRCLAVLNKCKVSINMQMHKHTPTNIDIKNEK
ncbi:MAG: hypothetical protein RR033_05915 [Clostridia bacterium]